MHPCRHLRWKGSGGDRLDVGRPEEVFADNQVPYSCLKTCELWGPDDLPAAPEFCGAQRGCFEPDPSRGIT